LRALIFECELSILLAFVLAVIPSAARNLSSFVFSHSRVNVRPAFPHDLKWLS